jgi:hypothetical protein
VKGVRLSVDAFVVCYTLVCVVYLTVQRAIDVPRQFVVDHVDRRRQRSRRLRSYRQPAELGTDIQIRVDPDAVLRRYARCFTAFQVNRSSTDSSRCVEVQVRGPDTRTAFGTQKYSMTSRREAKKDFASTFTDRITI